MEKKFICPECGSKIDYVIMYEKAWLAYKMYADGRVERYEDKDVSGDIEDLECPECGIVMYTIPEEIDA
ncbi:MAG: hypothetical protein QXE50_05755 [Nitrososphaerota archaeon]